MSEKIILDTGWKFRLGDVENGWYRGLDASGWEDVTVPHDWGVHSPFAEVNSSCTGYVVGGTAWYQKTFERMPKEGERVFLTFEGVYNHSQVWVNSNYLGKRPFGYATFTHEITEFLAPDGKNVISVKVDHSETADSRWFTGSGVTRPVYLTVTGKEYIENVFVTSSTVDSAAKTAKITVQTAVSGGEVSHRIEKDGVTLTEFTGTDVHVTLDGVKLWSADSPELYTLVTTLSADGEITDEKTTVFGIREVKFDAQTGLTVNGNPTKLKGVCLHHDAGCLGAAVPPSVWERRLAKLKECGTNAIRTSHNPPDPALLDLCDRMGFYVMDEAFDEWEGPKNKWYHGHNRKPSKLHGYFEDFREWAETDLKTMVLRDRSHPSVILWSIGNEVDYPNDPYVYPDTVSARGNNDAGKSEEDVKYDTNRPNARRLKAIAERLVKWVKECDPTRPVTSALSFPELSDERGYFDALDVTGYNYRESLYEARHAAHPDQVIYGSENGHGAREWAAVRDHDYICGQFLWTGIDYLGEAGGWPVRCSGAGVLDLAGYEKLRFFHRRAMWVDSLNLGVGTAPAYERWNYVPSWHYASGEMVKVSVPTNGVKVELFLNGEKLAEGAVEDYRCEFTVPFAPGELKAVAYDADGNTAGASLKTYGAPSILAVSEWKPTVSEPDVHQLEISLSDADSNLVCRDSLLMLKTDGELLGLENGDIADDTVYTAHYRKLNAGRLIAYIRGGTNVELFCSGVGTKCELH